MSVRDVNYGVASIRDFRPNYVQTDEGRKIESLAIGDTLAVPTRRFWTSLCCAFSSHGVSLKLFKLFDHAEVFERLVSRVGEQDSRLRWAVETPPNGVKQLLGVSNPSKALLRYAPTYEMMSRHAVHAEQASGGRPAISYNEGIIVAEHAPPFADKFSVGDDQFAPRYITETPIDGFGEPLTYLSLMRQVCTNGSIGYAAAFRSRVALGKDDTDVLATYARTLETFNNEEGYSALKQRFDASTESWASIREAQKAWETIKGVCSAGGLARGPKGSVDSLEYNRRLKHNLNPTEEVQQHLERAYLELSGDIVERYQLTSLESMSDKKQGQLPARCSVYELLNFVTEVATHWTLPGDRGVMGRRALQAYVGEILSHEYDLELTKRTHATFQDWFTDINVDPSLN